MTSYLIALLPPPELSERLQTWRVAHGLRDAAAVPHVTVKARSGLGPELDWLPAARAAVAAHPPVRLGYGPPRVFPRGRALYLPVFGAGPVSLHLALLEAVRPARRFGYEGPQLQAHLSVALPRRGLDLLSLQPDLEAAVAGLLPGEHTANTAALMRKPGPGGVYAVLEEWPLAGGASSR